MRAVGFLDDDPSKRERFIQGCPVHGTDELDRFIRVRTFDELIVSTPKIAQERLEALAERCALAGIPVRRFRIGWEEVGLGSAAAAESAEPRIPVAAG